MIKNYRKDIDGLRAISVVIVILYHAGLKIFSGGYIGVDVFFVISGYLITGIISKEIEMGSFSFQQFYERRIRRILPALYFVMLSTLPLAWLLMMPEDFKDYGKSFLGILTFVANVIFFNEDSYFTTNSDLKPFLHTWSLSVEEQFYIIFPFLLIILNRFSYTKRKTIEIIFLFFILSLLLSEYFLHNYPSKYSFYLLPFRAWEMLAGSLIALIGQKRSLNTYMQDHVPKWIYDLISAFGIILIIYCVYFYDQTTQFPGFSAFVPVVGAVLILKSNEYHQEGIVPKILSFSPLSYIGLISYSLYLWHQPIFAFFRLYQVKHDELSHQTISIAILLMTLLSLFSYKYIETPFRNRKNISYRYVLLILSSVTLILFSASAYIYINQGVASRLNLPQSVENSFKRKTNEECMLRKYTQDSMSILEKCTLGLANNNNVDFVIMGDSHAFSLFKIFDEAAKVRMQKGLIFSLTGCPSVKSIYLIGDKNNKNCDEFNEAIYNFVVNNKIKKVFLATRWNAYTESYTYDDLNLFGFSVSHLGNPSGSDDFIIKFSESIKFLKNNGIEVFVLTQVPLQRLLKSPQYVYRNYANKDSVEFNLSNLSIDRKIFDKYQMKSLKMFSDNLDEDHIIHTDTVLCNSQKCAIGDYNGSYYFDDNHLSENGANKLVGLIEKYL